MSFLGLEGLHCLVTGALGGIGSAIVDEFLGQGCKVTGLDIKPSNNAELRPNLHYVQGQISDEASVVSCMAQAQAKFGEIHVLAANAGITDESAQYNIWEMPIDVWDRVNSVNSRGTFLTIKHFLKAAEASQQSSAQELPNLAIVVTGSECGKFGQAGHVEYASGKSGLQYGVVRTVKNELVHLNARGRINAVAPGWVDTPLIGDKLDDPHVLWREAQATVPLRKIAQPTDVARAVVFLASHKAAGHISGECLSIDGGMEGRLLWEEDDASLPKPSIQSVFTPTSSLASSPIRLTTKSKQRMKILVSVDFDAVSGWLGTGKNAENTLADYSSGFFSAQVGVPRLLKLFKRLGISDKITWFIPGHSMESFPEQTKMIVNSGAEIALHGYCHEGAYQITPEQERDVLEKCIDLATSLTGKKPCGWRAPLYQLRESTIELLEEHGFLYDSSLSHHDSKPYFLQTLEPHIAPPSYSPMTPASAWMHPLPSATPASPTSLVEIPGNWYMEDMTPLQYWPHTANSQGYVDVKVVEEMWKARFEFLKAEMAEDEENEVVVFPLILHPDTSGMAHVIGMLERVLKEFKVMEEEGNVEFATMGDVARFWKDAQK